MEKWECYYLHEKAVRDSLCIMAGIPIPKDEKYGVLKRVNTSFFIAKKFWPELEKLGHNTVGWSTCKCSRGYL